MRAMTFIKLMNPKIKRVPVSLDDFGDEATVGAHVRDGGEPLNDMRTGVFLGCIGGKYCVKYYTVDDPLMPAGVERFSTVEDMRAVWELSAF
jgi:hypothetical protein